MSRRQFDLYQAERRAGHVVLVGAIWLVRAYVLGRYRAGDAARRLGRRP